MGTDEERRIGQEAARAVANRTGGVTRSERALHRFLAAEVFETHTETAPAGWADKPQHPAAPRTNTQADS